VPFREFLGEPKSLFYPQQPEKRKRGEGFFFLSFPFCPIGEKGREGKEKVFPLVHRRKKGGGKRDMRGHPIFISKSVLKEEEGKGKEQIMLTFHFFIMALKGKKRKKIRGGGEKVRFNPLL